MKVALVAPYPRTREAHGEESLGGVASYTKSLVAELRAHAKIVVVSPGPGPHGVRRDDDVEVRDVPQTPRAMAKALRELGRDPELDAVHVQFEQHLFGGVQGNLRLAKALRALKRRKRVVLTVHQVPDLHEVDRAFLARNGFPPLPFLARAWMRLQYALLAAACHLVVVHEPRLAQRLTEQYGLAPRRVAVVPHGVAPRELPCTRAEAKRKLGVEAPNLVLYFGYVTGYKGVDLLADALARLPPERRARTQVIIAGKVPERKLESAAFRDGIDDLEARIASLGAWVTRKGFLSAEDISLHLAAADVVVFPYRNVFSASGPFALTLGHGRPFLLSDAFRGMGAPEESLFAREPDALAAKLVEWLDDAALRKRLEAQARAMADAASWRRVAAQHAALYPRRARVLLMGAYGQDNLGDEALLEVHLQQLRGADVVVASTNPEQTAQRYGRPAVRTYGLGRTLGAFLASDAVVYGGGSVVKELPKPYPRYRVVGSLALLSTVSRTLGKGVAFSAVGFERLQTRAGRLLARRAARSADLLHVRDEGSQRLLGAMHVRDARVTADPAFLLEEDEAAARRADAILADANGRRVVVVNPMSSHESACSPQAVAASFSRLVGEIQTKLDAHVLVLPFKTAGEDNDVEAAQQVMLRVRDLERATLAPLDLRPAEALALMRRADFVVGMRHHAVILALVAGTPVLPVAYAPKTEHLAEEFHLGFVRAQGMQADALRDAFWRAWETRDEQRHASAKVVESMRERAKDNFDALRGFLATRSAA